MDNDDKNDDIRTDKSVGGANILHIIRDFWFFLRHPVVPKHVQNIDIFVVARLLTLLGITLFVSLILAYFIVEPYRNANGIGSPNITKLNMPINQLLFLVVFLAPVMEELIFRSWLRMTKRSIIAIASIALLLGGYWFFSTYVRSGLISVILISLWTNWMIFELYFGLRNNWHDMRTLARPYYPAIFYSSSLAFGLMHISNYDHDGFIILIPLIITQFWTGLVLGYTRVRYGLSAAILFHAAHNAILISIANASGNL